VPIAHIKRPTGKTRDLWSDARLRADKQIQKDYGDILALYPNHPIEGNYVLESLGVEKGMK
jgi:hypothetical protein